MRVHLRWEAYNLDALETALADIAAGRVHLLAFNDHTPAIMRKLKDPIEGAKYSARAGMQIEAFGAMAEEIAARAEAVPAALDRIAAAAGAVGLPMASHDDDSIAARDGFRARGARICEFPMAEEIAAARRRRVISLQWGVRMLSGVGRISAGARQPGWLRRGYVAF